MRGGGQWPTMRPATASALLSFGYLSDHANVFRASLVPKFLAKWAL